MSANHSFLWKRLRVARNGDHRSSAEVPKSFGTGGEMAEIAQTHMSGVLPPWKRLFA